MKCAFLPALVRRCCRAWVGLALSSGLEVVTAVEPVDQRLAGESVGGEVVVLMGAVVAGAGEGAMVAGAAWLGRVVL